MGVGVGVVCGCGGLVGVVTLWWVWVGKMGWVATHCGVCGWVGVGWCGVIAP